MLSCFSHQSASDFPKFVYLDGTAEVRVESPTDTETVLPEVQYDPNKKTEGEIWKTIDEKYGENPYRDLITGYLDKLMPREPDGYKNALVATSVTRYMDFYVRVEGLFMHTADDLRNKFDLTLDRLKGKVKSDLTVLKSAVEGARAMADFKETAPTPIKPGERNGVPVVGPLIDAVILEKNSAVQNHFETYLDALNGRYFNVSVNEGVKVPRGGIPILNPFIYADAKALDPAAYPAEKERVPILGPVIGSDVFKGKDYEAAATKFQDGMERWVDYKLAWLLKTGASQQDLQAFQEEIATRYELYSKMDGNSAILSGSDLATLEAVAFRSTPDMVGRILDESDDQTFKRLEVVQLLNPDGWEEAVQEAGKIIIQGAMNSGFEDQFLTAMQKYAKVNSFTEAVSEFRDLLGERAKVGVPETLEFLRTFNNEAQGEVLQFEQQVNPPALSYQVDRQMSYLLNGILVPQRDTDRMLVRFMRGNLEERQDILENDGSRGLLFLAIRQATEQYPELYQQQFPNIPDDVKKLHYSRRIEKPTAHDQAAQLQALIILGNQSKVIVTQLSKTQYPGKGYVEAMSDTPIPEDPKAVETGLKFKSPNKSARFRSALDLGGFNGRDLALKGAKVIGVLTVIANVAQSYSETSGDFMDRVFDTVEKSASNHGVLAGAAVTAGTHLAERNKAFLRYPWLSQHERSAAMTAFRLDNMGAKVGRKTVDEFLHNGAEWRALADTRMDGEQVKTLLKKADERAKNGEKPVILPSDIKEVIEDESIISGLTTGGKSARMRYLFYESFFASAIKPDVNHVKELTTGSSYISSSPVQTT